MSFEQLHLNYVCKTHAPFSWSAMLSRPLWRANVTLSPYRKNGQAPLDGPASGCPAADSAEFHPTALAAAISPLSL